MTQLPETRHHHHHLNYVGKRLGDMYGKVDVKRLKAAFQGRRRYETVWSRWKIRPSVVGLATAKPFVRNCQGRWINASEVWPRRRHVAQARHIIPRSKTVYSSKSGSGIQEVLVS